MLSFSNFGSVRHPEAEKVAEAVRLLRQRDPSLVVDGEMQADTALRRGRPGARLSVQPLKEAANVLIFPNLSAGNIAYKLLNHLGGATAIGPILVGMGRPVHVLEQGADVQDIVNMAAVAVIDAQDRDRNDSRRGRRSSGSLDRYLLGASDGRLKRSSSRPPLHAREHRRAWQARASLRRATVHWNLDRAGARSRPPSARGEGELADDGPFVAVTVAAHRPLAERQVRRARSRRPRTTSTGARSTSRFAATHFDALLADVQRVSQRPRRALRARTSTAAPTRPTGSACATCSPNAWHACSCATCSSARSRRSCATFAPNFTVLHAPEFQADPAKHGTRTGTFIVLNLAERTILIGGTRYAGELKKAMFTVMNYLLPKQGVLSMHCSANIGPKRRHGAVLRPVGHRQDDALRRPGARTHRRRRARLERRTACSTSKAAATPR